MKVKKVTNSEKVVTDPVMLKELARQKIDKDYVEFHEDYNAQHPFAKVYRDRKSGKRFQVISGLPKARKTDGVKIEAGWNGSKGKFTAKPNLFTAFVNGTKVDISVLNDQPNGTKAGDTVSWNPQLFIDDKRVSPISENATLLSVDPVNENYNENTLEWDYGVCKRRLRIIEGRVREKWVFAEKPDGKIRIKHNQSGKIKLRLGSGIDANGEHLPIEVINDDEERLDVFGVDFPVEIGASATFYPDADQETSSVDGYVKEEKGLGNGVAWETLRSSSGSGVDDSGNYVYCTLIYADNNSDKWKDLFRGITLFDTSALPDDCTITDAVLSIRGQSKHDGLNIYASTYLVIDTSNPASNTALVAGDFDSFGNNSQSGAISYNNFDTTDYNNFTLTETGKGNIDKTGISKFGVRERTYDLQGSAPDWVDTEYLSLRGWSSDKGAGFQPKLIVTYTEPALEVNVNDSVSTTDVVSKALLISLISIFSAVSPIDAVAVDAPFVPPHSINVNDTITLAENSPLVMDDLGIDAHDSVEASDVDEVELVSFVDVHDAVGIAEDINTILIPLINVNDAVSIAENIDTRLYFVINVDDSVTLAENVSSVMDDMEISLDDDITIEEWSPVNCPQEINVYDSVSIVSESVEISIAWPINVYDTITLAESITTVLPDALAIDINDAVGVAEDVTVSIYDFTINVNDTITPTEDVSLLQISYISAGDDITLAEDVSSVMTDMAVDVNDAVSTAESIGLILISLINTNDAVSTAESISFVMSDSEISVSESITIVENTNEVLVSFIDTDDTITLAESIEVVPDDLTVNLNDNVILEEDITVSIYDFSIDVNDMVSVNEYTTLAIGNLVPSVYDTIILAEDVSLTMSDIDVGVNDSITLSELISTALAYTINVNDTVLVIENVDVDLLISIDESDTITLAENVGINIPITIFIDEDIALAESIDIGISDFEINVNNTITINELAISDLQVSINTNDSIAITEDVDIDASRVLSVYESISIAENVPISGVIQGDIDVSFSISQPDVSFSTIQPDVVFSVSQPDVKFERG